MPPRLHKEHFPHTRIVLIKPASLLMILLLLLLLFSHLTPAFSSPPVQSIAEQTAQCLSAHITLETEPYLSGETQKYFLLLSRLQGTRQAMQLMQSTLKTLKQNKDQDRLQIAINSLQQNCPLTDRYINTKNP